MGLFGRKCGKGRKKNAVPAGSTVNRSEGSALSGEREILDGTLQYCIRNPKNETARMLLIQTLRQMKKTRPDIIPEFKDKVENLQNEFPMVGTIGELSSPAIKKVFAV